ncbi:MAG TPA: aminotransferase class V-fold PLP-dependent enzyme [Edaphobacter sp.]|jgi:glutamate/tyrosine decarboxylase-like PLP-dependent enzyme|nr:aminotransferase class V-fold PLP-dependent enzyme [Edaphobacter sp.]
MSQNPPPFQAPLAAAFQHAIDHLTPASSSSVAATTDLATLRKNLSLPLNDSGQDPTEVINHLVKAVEGGLIDSAGPRFFGWVIGGSLPAALAADWLTSVWDQNACMYATSPAAAVVEEVAGAWLKDLLRLPASASFALVTGCQMAHVICLLAARHALLARRKWDVEKEGLAGSPPIRILTSTELHGSTIRAIRMLGLGEKHITCLPTDAEGRLREDALTDALKSSPSQPTILVLQAGDLNIGAFDDFAKLIPIAKQHGAWVHVDGAFGLWCAATPRLRHLLNGADAADSWTTDGHKWLNVPFDCGYAFVADPEAHRASLSLRASYLTHASDVRDQMDWNPEWSRRARGFATYAALRQLGRQGIADLIERTCDHARAIVTRIGALEGAEVVWEPQINQGLVRFHTRTKDASPVEDDAYTDRVMAEILASGEAFFTGTTWHGRRAMRVSVCNWQTSTEDVDRVVASVDKILHATSEKN